MSPLAIAVLTISDSRTPDNDTSGDLLVERLTGNGHLLASRALIPDNVYQIRATVSNWILPLFDKTIEGFGELFRQISYEEIGSSTIQSRAVAGLTNATLIFAVPGSTNACATAWDHILQDQLDSTFRPCNFAELISRFNER